MVVADAAHDDTEIGAAHFDLVRAFGNVPGFHFVHLGAEATASRFRESRHHHVLGDIAFEVRHHCREFFLRHDDRLGMVHASGHAEDDRNLELFARLHGDAEEVVGFLGVTRFEHRANGCLRVVTRILFVLGAALARVIGNNPHHAAIDTRVSCGIENITCHIQANHFHGDNTAGMSKSGTESDFGSDLFVRSPLGIAAQFRVIFQDFGGRSSRIACGKLNIAMTHGKGNGFVARNQHLFRIWIKSWHDIPFLF